MAALRHQTRILCTHNVPAIAVCVILTVALGQLHLLDFSPLVGTPGLAALQPITGAGPVTALALSPDKKSLIIANHSGIEIREFQSDVNGVQRMFEADLVSDLEFSPDGTMLAVAGGTPGQFGLTEILKWPSCEPYALYRDFDEVCTAAAWSPDGRHLAIGCHDSKIQIYGVKSGQIEATNESHSRAITGLVWTTTENRPETSTLLISSSLDQSIRLFVPGVTERGMMITQTRILDQHTREVQGIALANTESRFQTGKLTLVSWGDDRTIRFWHPTTGRMLRFAKLESEVVDAVWDNDGTIVIAALANGDVVTVELKNAGIQRLERFDQPITRVSVSPENRQLIAGDFRGQVHLVPLPTASDED